ncbi:transmembrane protein 87A-like, partial [Centroberyx gerrardi]
MSSSAGPAGSGTGTGLRSTLLLLLLATELGGPVRAVSEPGKWILSVDSETLKKPRLFFYTKTLFNSSVIRLSVLTDSCDSSPSSPVQLNVSWYLRNSHCYDEIFSLDDARARSYFNSTEVKPRGGSGFYVFHQYPVITCLHDIMSHKFNLDVFDLPVRLTEPKTQQPFTEKTPGRRRREVDPPKPKSNESVDTGKDAVAPKQAGGQTHFDAVAQSWEDGPYMFILSIQEIREKARAPDPANPPKPWSIQ